MPLACSWPGTLERPRCCLFKHHVSPGVLRLAALCPGNSSLPASGTLAAAVLPARAHRPRPTGRSAPGPGPRRLAAESLSSLLVQHRHPLASRGRRRQRVPALFPQLLLPVNYSSPHRPRADSREFSSFGVPCLTSQSPALPGMILAGMGRGWGHRLPALHNQSLGTRSLL